jgi:hypothetical protein
VFIVIVMWLYLAAVTIHSDIRDKPSVTQIRQSGEAGNFFLEGRLDKDRASTPSTLIAFFGPFPSLGLT